MPEKQKHNLKRIVTLILIITMLVPNIAFAYDYESPWFQLPEIEPFEYDPFEFPEEESFIPYYTESNPDLAEPPPELIEAIFRAQEADWQEDSRIRELVEFYMLIHSGVAFSGLTEDEINFIYRHLDIAYESIKVTNELFTLMEHNGHTLAESVELIRIMSGGLFDYLEAQIILKAIPNDYERLAEIEQFEQFARKFNIADSVNPRRIVNNPFIPTNEFETIQPTEWLRPDMALIEPPPVITATPAAIRASLTEDRATAHSIFTAFTNESAFDEARRMFLDNYSVDEIEAAFAIGAVLTEMQTIRQTTGSALYVSFRQTTGPALYVNMQVDSDELEDIIAYGLALMSVAPMSAPPTPTHENIVGSPFNLHFNANESVALNTGASMFRTNVLSLPGRGGFGLNLDLLYNSANAEIRTPSGTTTTERRDPFGIGIGWQLDLPFITDNVLYIPGRGSFAINGNQFVDHTLQDKRIHNDTSFTSGSLRSTRRVTFHNGTSYFFSGEHVIGMQDRFGNTIRFEYANIAPFGNRRMLTSITDTNSKQINFQYQGSGASRTITITAPDASTYVINLSQIPGHSDFRVDSVRNQVGAVTSFVYDVQEARFNATTKTPNRINHALLLRQVNYPSGAQLRFQYSLHTENMGRNGSRQVWKVASRLLFNNGREYLRTTFVYQGNFTASYNNVCILVVA
ncbi:MAG: hypothetical protein FWB91_03460 [Defluviitaleaceae bacterium]|nr:hypothetical protein [Defluviitaleaceae bacterium]